MYGIVILVDFQLIRNDFANNVFIQRFNVFFYFFVNDVFNVLFL